MLSVFIVTVLAGYMLMFMIYGLATVIAVRGGFLKCSAASWIASFFVTLPCSLLLLVLFPQDLTKLGNLGSWVVALYMLGTVSIFVGWLKAFEPDSLEILTLKQIRNLELKKIEIQHSELERLIKEAKKNKKPEAIPDFLVQIKNLKQAKKLIKQHHKVPGLFTRVKAAFVKTKIKSS